MDVTNWAPRLPFPGGGPSLWRLEPVVPTYNETLEALGQVLVNRRLTRDENALLEGQADDIADRHGIDNRALTDWINEDDTTNALIETLEAQHDTSVLMDFLMRTHIDAFGAFVLAMRIMFKLGHSHGFAHARAVIAEMNELQGDA